MCSTLARLSDKELLARLKTLVRRERTTTLDILRHLCEVEARGLQLRLGYGSLFDYCTEGLGYSASAAVRRIKTARCLGRFPEVESLLARGEVNLTTVAQVAPVLEAHNQAELLAAVRGRTQREVEAVVSRYRQPVANRDRVRSVCVRVPEVPANAKDKKKTFLSANNRSGGSTFFHKVGEGGGDAREGGCDIGDGDAGEPKSDGEHSETWATPAASATSSDGSGRPGAATTLSTRIERKVLIQFMASPEFMNKYDEVRSLLSHRLRESSFQSVLGALMDEFIDRHSPKKRKERRQKREANRSNHANNNSSAAGTRAGRTSEGMAPTTKRNIRHSGRAQARRHIPAAVRDEVFARDGGRCTYVGSTGRRCRSRRGLQIDHIVPVARGGPNDPANLRLLCAKHNRLEAERLMGPGITAPHRRSGGIHGPARNLRTGGEG